MPLPACCKCRRIVAPILAVIHFRVRRFLFVSITAASIARKWPMMPKCTVYVGRSGRDSVGGSYVDILVGGADQGGCCCCWQVAPSSRSLAVCPRGYTRTGRRAVGGGQWSVVRGVWKGCQQAGRRRAGDEGEMDGFAVDDPGGGSIRVPGPMLPEMMLRCSGVPGAELALVSAAAARLARAQPCVVAQPPSLC